MTETKCPSLLPVHLTPEEIDRLEKPDFRTTWPMQELIAGWDALEAQYGYLVGDLNTDGLLNVARIISTARILSPTFMMRPTVCAVS